MGWINQLLDETSEYEAPSSYYFWSGLVALSAAVKDHVWIPRSSDRFKTYPAIYVLLLAKTGVTRKSHPPSLIEQIMDEAKITRIFTGRSSIEKIMDDLGTAHTTDDKRVIKDSAGCWIMQELSANIIANNQALTILTNLFDRNYNVNSWKVNLKSSVKNLKSPTLSLLAATNDQHMKSFMDAKDMYGGFLGRTFVISEDSPKRLNPLVRPSEKFPDVARLACYLREINKECKGPFSWESDDAMRRFEDWYMGYYEPVMNGEADVEDKTGTFSRIGDHVLKVAMLLSISESKELILTMNNIEEAIALCTPFVEVSARAVRGIGKSTLAAQTAMVMDFLEKRNGYASRVSILQRFQGDIDSEDLSKIQVTLEESKFIVIEVSRAGTAYQVPPNVLEKYRKFKAARRGGDAR